MQVPEYLMGALTAPEDAARFGALVARFTTPGPCFAMLCGLSPRREGKSRMTTIAAYLAPSNASNSMHSPDAD